MAETPPTILWTYVCRSCRVIDGDTVEAELDLGFSVSTKVRIRLARINAPEMSTAEGVVSKKWLESTLDGKEIIVRTRKLKSGNEHDPYGRYLGELFVGDLNVNDLSVEKGQSVIYKVK